jgi:hypothetical protein
VLPKIEVTTVTYLFTEKERKRLRRIMDQAPSILNQRPWDLRPAIDDEGHIVYDRLEVWSVPDERLGRLLPREVVISCGAALYNLRLAIQVAGREPSISLLPRLGLDKRLLTTVASTETWLASVEIMPGRAAPPTDAEQELYEALWLRRTDRRPFRYLPIPPQILVEMENAAAHERGWLRVLPPREHRRVLRAVASANRRIRAKADLENELFNPDKMPPGGLNKVPYADYGPTPAGKQAEEAPLTRPTFWLENEFAPFEDRRLTRWRDRLTRRRDRRQTQLMGLSTDDDRPLDWLRAGEAMQHALLNGTRFSMSALGGRSTPYRQELYYAPLDPHQLWRRPPAPGGYAVEASFLTQSLELADLIALERAGQPALEKYVAQEALELADLEAVDPLDPGNKQRRKDSQLRWPWRTYFTEIPQVVLRVGYTPVRGAFVPPDGRQVNGSDESVAGEPRVMPAPRPAEEACTVPFPRPAYDDDQYPVPHSPPEEDEL